MSGQSLSLLGCSCFLTFVGYSQASFISATLLKVFLVNFRGFVLHYQHNSFLDPSHNFCGFVHDFSQGPSSNSHSSVQHYSRNSSPNLSCNFCSFVLHCQHGSFLNPSCNFVAASCTIFLLVFHVAVTASFVLHCQHGSSLNLLDNLPSFCQLSSDCLPRSTTRILHAFTLVLSSCVHTC